MLIILNYRPSIESRPFSFAFNLKGENKCWISYYKVKKICGKSPNCHEDYVDFNHKTHKFYAYSVEAFKDTTFSNIAEFKKICNTLYTHIDQVDGGRWKVGILTRTREALGGDLMKQLNSLHFCIVGCGGTGTTFSEMLVRSGAKNIDLVDGGNVDLTNLNRVFSFASGDVGKKKVDILKKRLKSITPEINVRSFAYNLIPKEDTVTEDPLAQKVRNSIREADVVFIGTNTNKSRMTCEGLCSSSKLRRECICQLELL